MKRPISTYRLQVTADFPLGAAADLADYLHDLGADWVYLSPLLTATPGSTHGYDVVDHGSVDPERGGAEGLDRASAAARAAGLGVLVDIVPNHMGVARPEVNAWWWGLLREGRSSEFAYAFDIDWDAGAGRLRIPVLGETIAEAAASGALRVEGGELRYYDDHRYPLAPGSADDGAAADVVHGRQHYELVDWHRADDDLNYRRFFAVSDLAALRVELADVFEATHREIVRWLHEGLVDGIRVDHPDGLADPGGYLDALAVATDGAYVLVEKILENGETVPPFWATQGTTGYDALGEIDRILIDPAGRRPLDALDSDLRGTEGLDWTAFIDGTKREIAEGILFSEVRRLVRDLRREDASESAPDAELEDAIIELLACFPVYRSYLPYGAEDLAHAAAEAERRRPDLTATLARVVPALADPTRAVAVRFQQTSGMVMAKGVEDTAFYRVSRLASLTEVGADPATFSLTPAEFHRAQQNRHAATPASMTTLSTHDTKRGEDTRARIDAISEVPEEWRAFLERRRAARTLDDGPFENLLWQSIVGSWPREREALHAYAEKASREAGTSTAWTEPNEEFEQRMHALVDELFDDPEVAADVAAIVELLREPGYTNGLAAKVVQLTAPGMPDVYQGSELWERSLVDPDNRRAVDYDDRRRMLALIDAGALPPVDESGAAKLLLTSRALRLRRDRQDLFDRYLPVPAVGSAAEHVLAFDRGGAITVATRLSVGLAREGGWGDTRIILPAGPYVDLLTDRPVGGGEVELATLLSRYPVALLAPVSTASTTPARSESTDDTLENDA